MPTMNIVVNISNWKIEWPVAHVASSYGDGHFITTKNSRDEEWANCLWVIFDDGVLYDNKVWASWNIRINEKVDIPLVTRTSCLTWSHWITVTHQWHTLDRVCSPTCPWSWDLQANFLVAWPDCETKSHVHLSSIQVHSPWRHPQAVGHHTSGFNGPKERHLKLLHQWYCAYWSGYEMGHAHHEMPALHWWGWEGSLCCPETSGYTYRGSWLIQIGCVIHKETNHQGHIAGLNQGEGEDY